MRTPSAKERLVLDLLADGERYGLDLVRESGGLLKRGTIYVLLDLMESRGLIRSRAESGPVRHHGWPRLLYSLAEAAVQATMKAAVVLAIHDGRVLALTRGDDMADWHLPGGKVEANESFPQAASRELEEETGLRYGPDEMTHLCDLRSGPYAVRVFLLKFIPPAVPMLRTEAGTPGWVPASMLVTPWCTFADECTEIFARAARVIGMPWPAV